MTAGRPAGLFHDTLCLEVSMLEPERILVVSPTSLSGVVAATPVLNAVRELRPGALVTVLVDKEHEGILSGHPWVDSVMAWDRRRVHRGPAGFLRLARALRAQSWDIAIDLCRGRGSGTLLRAARAATTLRAPRVGSWTSLLVSARFMRFFARRTKAETLLGSVAKLGEVTVSPSPRLFLRPEWTGAAKNLLRQTGLKEGTLAAIAPGASWEANMWPAERYGELVKRLSCAVAGVLVLGTSEEKDLCTKVVAGRPGVVDLAGRLALVELLGVLAQCAVVVGNDAGATHCAQALGIPTVALFGPTDGRQFVFSPGRCVQRTVPCGPCSIGGSHRCPTGDHACMRGISVDEVFGAVTQLLPPLKEPEAVALKW